MNATRARRPSPEFPLSASKVPITTGSNVESPKWPADDSSGRQSTADRHMKGYQVGAVTLDTNLFCKEIPRHGCIEFPWPSPTAGTLGASGKDRHASLVEEVFETSCHLAHLGTWQLDMLTGTLQWSQEMYRLHGIPPGTPVDLNCMSKLYGADAERLKAAIRGLYIDGGSFQIEVPLEGPKSAPITSRIRLTANRDTSRHIVFGLAQPVPDRLASSGEMERKPVPAPDNRSSTSRTACVGASAPGNHTSGSFSFFGPNPSTESRAAFLTNVSHELRTPMNGVLGLLDQLLDTRMGIEQRELAETIRVSATAVQSLITGVLDLARLGNGMPLAPESCEVRPFLHELLGLHQGSAQHSRVTLELQVEDEVPAAVYVDPTRLRQVLMNLVANAVKFTLPGGTVTLCVSCLAIEDDKVRLEFSVTDTGIGIAEEHRIRIFQPFEQVDTTSTRRYGGTGLGLTLASRAAELLEGSLAVDSEYGCGSVFRFTSTMAISAPKSAVGSSDSYPAISPEDIRPLHILLAEDNRVNQRVIVKMLESMGHTVCIANDGLEAVGLYLRHNFDMVLLDIQMPVMDGEEAFRFLLEIQTRSGRAVPIVAVTANTHEKDRERYLNAGMHGYVTKPVQKRKLLQELARAFGRAERRAARVARSETKLRTFGEP